MTEDDLDYITIKPAVSFERFNVVVMKCSRGEYSVFRCSDAITRDAAEQLAKSWAAAMRCEIR